MRNSLYLALVLALLGKDGWAAGPAKAGGRIRAALVPVTVTQGEPSLAGLVEKAATDELTGSDLFQLPPPKTLKAKLTTLTKKKVFGPNCTKWPACIRKTGAAIASSVMFFTEVSATADKVTINIQAYDVKSGKLIRSVSETSDPEQQQIEHASRWAIRLAAGPAITAAAKGKGKLRVNSTVPDAEIIVNGKSFGQRSGKVFNVSSGAFDIMVRKEGYQPFREVVIVKANALLEVSAELSALEKPAVAVVSPEEKPAELPPPIKKEEKPDLPAWAIFETPKKTEPLTPQPPVKESAIMALPLKEKPEPITERKPQEPDKEERSFWQTWWFWTIVGTAVAAGAGTTTYFLLSGGGGEPSAGLGSAVIHWE